VTIDGFMSLTFGHDATAAANAFYFSPP